MAEPAQLGLPFGQTSYIAAFDDGQLSQHELKESEPSWRPEGYAKDSSIHILDHKKAIGTNRTCNDSELDEVLAEPPPQVRFFLLLPTVHERIAEDLFERVKKAHIQNGMTEVEAEFEVPKAAAVL